jgi:hypothetical protein
MIITRVKSGDKIHIEWQVETALGEVDDYSMTCSDKARPEFYQALNDLAPHVVQICELPKEYASGLSVIGVRLTWTNDIMGAVISAKKALMDCSSPLFLNTPHMPEKPYGESAGGSLLPEKTVEALDEVVEEAERYLKGERAQMSLFPAGEKKPAPELELVTETEPT